jgi:predicted kinase
MLTIIRGLPGSGKSTLANLLCLGTNSEHIESDQYFMQGDKYVFDPKKLKEAHEDCQNRCDKALSEGKRVVVSNTFTMRWEADAYFELAKKHGVMVNIIECHGDFGSIHDVPVEVIENMKNRWQDHSEFVGESK